MVCVGDVGVLVNNEPRNVKHSQWRVLDVPCPLLDPSFHRVCLTLMLLDIPSQLRPLFFFQPKRGYGQEHHDVVSGDPLHPKKFSTRSLG